MLDTEVWLDPAVPLCTLGPCSGAGACSSGLLHPAVVTPSQHRAHWGWDAAQLCSKPGLSFPSLFLSFSFNWLEKQSSIGISCLAEPAGLTACGAVPCRALLYHTGTGILPPTASQG